MFNKVTSRSYSYFFKFSNFFIVEKWNPPTRSETAEIGQKNRRNFRGYSRLLIVTFVSSGQYMA
jgi:hypothetical protein